MQFDSLGGFLVCQCAYTTCHHLLPGPPFQSEREVVGLRGPQGPSDMSDCCCSCQGNRGRQCDRRWRFLSFLRRMLYWRKGTVEKRKKEGEDLKGRTLQNALTPNYSRRVWRKVRAFAKIASISTRLQLDYISQLTWVHVQGKSCVVDL